jgi:two-component system cell cycle response regulator DivK
LSGRWSWHEQADSGGRGPGGQSPDHPRYAPTDYEITEAENGEEALAAIAKQRPDLILMDIQLPIMDGYTATSRIKADPGLRSIPIIAVTSYALSGEEKKARAAGCDDYVPKPFSPRQLLAKIRQYLSTS